MFFLFKDTRVWIPDADKVWKAARLLENYDPNQTTLKVLTEDDEIVIFFYQLKINFELVYF